MVNAALTTLPSAERYAGTLIEYKGADWWKISLAHNGEDPAQASHVIEFKDTHYGDLEELIGMIHSCVKAFEMGDAVYALTK